MMAVESELDTSEHCRIKDLYSCMGVVERDKEMLLEWVLNKLAKFGPFLGLSYKGFEEEILVLLKRIVMKRDRDASGGTSNSALMKRLRNELKKLEFNVNYDRQDGSSSVGGSRKGKGFLRSVHGS